MKRTVLLIVLVMVIVLGYYGYREYSRQNKDLAKVAPSVTTTAPELIRAFESDSASANKKYLGKIIAVRGVMKSIEREAGAATLILGEQGSMSSVRCSMDTLHLNEVANVRDGQSLTVKGECTGFNQDELLGSDVVLSRCVLTSSKQ